MEHVGKSISDYFEARKGELMLARQGRAAELLAMREKIGDLSQSALSLEAALARIDGALVNLDSMKASVAKIAAEAVEKEEE